MEFQVDAVFAKCDENQDGKLSLEEFTEMMEEYGKKPWFSSRMDKIKSLTIKVKKFFSAPPSLKVRQGQKLYYKPC